MMRQPRLDSPSETANETWRMWLLTGVRRGPADRRRVRGSNVGLKRMLVEGMKVRFDHPYTWKEFSDAMVRQSVGEAMHSMPREDAQLVKLAYFAGMTNREIARNLDLGEATVERRLRRAIDVISRYIERGRGLGQRVLASVAVWLTGRWVSDTFQHAAPATVVGAAAAVLLVQAAPAQAPAPPVTYQIEQPAPSPTLPAIPRSSVPETPTAVAPVAPVLPQASPPSVSLPQVNLPPVPRLPKLKDVL